MAGAAEPAMAAAGSPETMAEAAVEAPEPASLHALLETCEESKLAAAIEALLVAHPELAPEVRQMLSREAVGAAAAEPVVADAEMPSPGT